MRWLLLVLLCLPFASAASMSGWYYPGDNFTFDGVTYRIAGTATESLLLDTGKGVKLIPLAECIKEGLTEYCYVESAYPDDDAHTRYVIGDVHYGFYLSIETVTPSVSVSREVSEEEPALGETVVVSITVQNTGDYSINEFSYKETIPDGLKLSSGTAVAFTKKTIPSGTTEKLTYRVKPIAYGTFTFSPNVSYRFEGKRYEVEVGAETISVDSPLEISRSVTKTLEMDAEGKYELNITNEGEETIEVSATITLPDGFSSTTQTRGLVRGASGYTMQEALSPDEALAVSFPFSSMAGGTFLILLEVTAIVDGLKVTERFNDSVTSNADGLVPTLQATPVRTAYTAGEKLQLKGILKNANDAVTFSTIKGSLVGKGLFDTVSFEHEQFPPGKMFTEAQASVTLPDVSVPTNYTVIFSGTYRTPKRTALSYEAERTIAVLPASKAVQVRRTVTPMQPKPGDTIEVAVTAENIADGQISLDAHEKYDSALARDGETFKELTLDKGAAQQLYAYTLAIPANYTKSSFTLTTSVLLEGAPVAQEFSTDVMLAGAPAETPAPAPVEVVVEQEAAQSGKKELGFFASIWDYLKKLLN